VACSAWFATAEHEIGEILGLGSALNGLNTPATPWAEDLFRYGAPGVRSYGVNTCGSQPNAYFSINGGTTNLDDFNNCGNRADYGDWVTHSPSRVQDGFTNGTGNASLTATSPETRALDVMGYSVAQVPEPATVVLLGTGIVAIFIVQRRGHRH
jgi:hypothetical protein